MSFAHLTDLLFYIMYIPAARHRLGKTPNALRALCFNVCVYSTTPVCFLFWFLLPHSPAASITALIFLFVAEVLLFRMLHRTLWKRYTKDKTVEVENRYKPLLGTALTKTIYWLIVIISIPLMLSIPFIIVTGSFPRLNL